MKLLNFGAIAIAFAVGVAAPASAGIEYLGEVVTSVEAAADPAKPLKTKYTYWEKVKATGGKGWLWNHCEAVISGLNIGAYATNGGCLASIYHNTGVDVYNLKNGQEFYVPARLQDDPAKAAEVRANFVQAATAEQKAAEAGKPVARGEVAAMIAAVVEVVNTNAKTTTSNFDTFREEINGRLEGVKTEEELKAIVTATMQEQPFISEERFNKAMATLDGRLKLAEQNSTWALRASLTAGAVALATLLVFGLWWGFGGRKTAKLAKDAIAKADSTVVVVGDLQTSLGELKDRMDSAESRLAVVEDLTDLLVSVSPAGDLEGAVPTQAELTELGHDEVRTLPVACADGKVRQCRIFKVVSDGKHYVQLPDISDQGQELVRANSGIVAMRIAKASEMNTINGAEVRVASMQPATGRLHLSPTAAQRAADGEDTGGEHVSLPRFLRPGAQRGNNPMAAE